MNFSLLSFLYLGLPYVPLVYTLAVYVSPRPMSRGALWLVGMSIAVVLTALVATFMNSAMQGAVPLYDLVAFSASLCILPMAPMVWVVDGLRRRNARRWLGVIALIAVFLVAREVAPRFAFLFIDIVNASG